MSHPHASLNLPSTRFVSVLLLVALLGSGSLPGSFSSQAALSAFPKGARPTTRALLTSGTAAATDRPTSPRAMPETHQAARTRANEAYGKLPLSFVENRGQADPRVQFLARGGGYNLFLTATEAVFTLHRWGSRKKVGAATIPDSALMSYRPSAAVLRLKLLGADPAARGEGNEELPGKSNYYIGNDPNKWLRNISSYARVRYRAVYPGVDLEYYGNQNLLEYDFIVAPGADARIIKLSFEGARKIYVDAGGDLALYTEGGEVRQRKPLFYQDVEGRRKEIQGRYVIKGKREVGFEVMAYDKNKPLVIDPVLGYSSYLGGSNQDFSYGIAVDSSGNAYMTGETFSTNFPGTFNPVYIFDEAFVTKINSAGTAIVYSTYLGGSQNETGNKIAVDSAGNAYVVGTTNSANFPVTAGSYQPTLRSVSNAFVTKFGPTGSIVYSTYLGGNGTDIGRGIAVDSSGNAYVTGATYSTTFPVTAGAFQTFKSGDGDVFVTKLNPAGSALVYSTYIGGSNQDEAHAVAIDSSGNAYVTGFTYSTSFPKTVGAFQTSLGSISADAFVTKLNASGTALVYSTFLGGINDDFGYSLALDSSNNAYVTGETFSNNFPVTQGAFQTAYAFREAFATKLNAAGSALAYSTYLGGGADEVGRGIAVDSSGNAYVAGSTFSTNFPQIHALQQPNANFGTGGAYDVFVVKLNATGSRPFYSTYLGGGKNDFGRAVAVDAAGNAYVSGSTESTNFPTRNPFQSVQADGGSFNDTFVTKLVPVFYNISGRVIHSSGGGVAGVTMTLTGSQSATTQTNSNGDYILAGVEEGGSYTVTPSNGNLTFTPPNRVFNDLSSDQTANFTQNDVVQLSQLSYTISEGQLFAAINVTRTDAAGPATVKYQTSDTTDVNFRCDPSTAGQPTGQASRKCDYHIASGRLRFAAGESSKQIILSLVDDVYVEGPENFTLTLSGPTGILLGQNNVATVTITDNDTPGKPNPIDNTRFFVRQLYVDLLSREPDQVGWDGWTNRIDLCGQPGQLPPPCDRVTVGGDGFLRSAEFFDRQFFVLRLYRTGFGRILQYSEVGDLAYVSGFLSPSDLEINKQELVADIMTRSEFTNKYNGLGNAAFVDTLLQTAVVTVPQPVRDGWVSALGSSSKSRAQVFREISERQEVADKYLTEAQVVSAYYGFFTRNPDGAYLNFLDRLNRGEINLGDLANAFINAAEYRQRFGP